jgi:hypothetical protein
MTWDLAWGFNWQAGQGILCGTRHMLEAEFPCWPGVGSWASPSPLWTSIFLHPKWQSFWGLKVIRKVLTQWQLFLFSLPYHLRKAWIPSPGIQSLLWPVSSPLHIWLLRFNFNHVAKPNHLYALLSLQALSSSLLECLPLSLRVLNPIYYKAYLKCHFLPGFVG